MIAEVISIGDEMTSGQRLDTNSQWLSQQLGDLGLRTMFHTTVADDLAANVRIFREAVDRADVIVATGGLGPTADDLTRQALADTLGVGLVLNEQALADIRALFARRKRAMPERNAIQAMFPQGSRVVRNPHGTAPGIDLEVPRAGRAAARIFALPGVPAEMKEMWQGAVEPALRARLGDKAQVIVHRVIRCFGVGESDLEAMMPDIIARQRYPLVGITVSQATLSLRISAIAPTRDEALRSMEPTVQTIRECAGNLIFGEGEDELQHAIVRLLTTKRQTLAICECGTGGRVADWLSEVQGSDSVFAGGEILPAARLAMPEQVRAQAAACRARFGADYAIAIGPFPALATAGAEPGHVHIALATAAESSSRSALFAGHPDIVKDLTGKRALNYLRLHLLGEPA